MVSEANEPGSESGKRSNDRRGVPEGTPQEGGASTPLAAPGSFAAAAMTTRTASQALTGHDTCPTLHRAGCCVTRRAETAAVDPGEEPFHALDHQCATHRGEDLEGVLRARELRVDERRARHAAEGGREAARALDRHERVVSPVQDEEGRRGGPEAGERGRLLVRLGRAREGHLQYPAREEPAQRAIG